MQELVEYIVKSIVRNPDAVEVTEEQDGDRVLVKVKVDKDDMGAVIGKKGAVINAIRSIVRVKAIKDGIFVRVDLVEED